MKVIDCEQGTPEWKLARAGKVTASRIRDVLSRARDKKSEGSTRRNYRAQIVSEILTGEPQEKDFTNRAIEDGIEREPFARSAYEIQKGLFVQRVGLVVHPTIDRAGASPDGLVGDDGLIQIKCPYPATHIAYLDAEEVPAEYQDQMLWEMACTGRAWCDFVSYCPTLPPYCQLFTARFPRDDKRILAITAEVLVFLQEVDATIARLQRKAA